MKVELRFPEILSGAMSLVRDVPVYFGTPHLARCDKTYRIASRFESCGDVERENARYACTMIAGVGQSPKIRAICGRDPDCHGYCFSDIGEITATFIQRLCDGEVFKDEYPALVNAIRPFEDVCLQGLRDWSKDQPVTSLGRWIASVRQIFSAEEMWAISIYSNKGDPVKVVNERFVLPGKEKKLPFNWANELYATELSRLLKTQDSPEVRRLVATYQVLDVRWQAGGDTFNGTISKHTAALILRDYDWLSVVFGDFDIEEVEDGGGFYYFCGPRKILEVYQ